MRIATLILLFPLAVSAQTPSSAPSSEQGTFVLHKFAKAIGKETWSITPSDGKLTLNSDFLFTDRGSPVPLKTTFTATPALEPLTLTVAGRSSRFAALNDSLRVDSASHSIVLHRDGKDSSYPATAHAFLIDGYSPVAMQQMLLRYWLSHGKPASIDTPPTGSVHIIPAGDLTVSYGGKQSKLHGYVLTGLIWGGETLWMNDAQQLAALVSIDAEFDHFEAVREEYEAALPQFISAAAKNQLDALAALSSAGREPHARRLLITNATVIDGTGAPASPGTAVLVEDGRITRITHAERMDTKNVAVIDGTGKFLIPGLWDMHAHYEQVEWGPIYLAAGVTTVRDCGNEFDFITTVRDTLDAGKGIGPRVLIAGIVDGSGPTSLGAVLADTPDQAVAVVRRYHDVGAKQIKIYSSMKPELVPVITAEAHRLGMTVTGHVPNGMTGVQAIEAGYDQINHIQYPLRDLLPPPGPDRIVPKIDLTTPQVQKVLDVYKSHHTLVDDTMSLYEIQYRPSTIPVVSFEPGIQHVAPQLSAALDAPGMPPAQMQRIGNVLPDMLAVLRKLHEIGIPIVAGTDQNIPGYSVHRELEIYVESAGFTPMEALQAATLVPARAMGVEKETGTLEVGKCADMVLLDADPLADIHNTRRVSKTIRNGEVYDPAPLWRSVEFKP